MRRTDSSVTCERAVASFQTNRFNVYTVERPKKAGLIMAFSEAINIPSTILLPELCTSAPELKSLVVRSKSDITSRAYFEM